LVGIWNLRAGDFKAGEVFGADWEGEGHAGGSVGDVDSHGFDDPGIRQCGGGFYLEVSAVCADVAGSLDPGDFEGGTGGGGSRQWGEAGGGACGAAEEVFDAVGHAVVVMVVAECL